LLKLGIDEAGRGPVIGDMFVAGIVLDSKHEGDLVSVGVKDSKALSPQRRAELFSTIISKSYAVIVTRFGPNIIDKSNINSLFLKAIKDILTIVFNKLHYNIEEVIIDAVRSSRLINELRSFLANMGNGDVKLVVEEKADAKYVVVSAASIIAKHLRDTHIRLLHTIYGDFGSGYPSDPKTISWLSTAIRTGEIPPIIRRSWYTVRRLGLRVNQDLLKWAKK